MRIKSLKALTLASLLWCQGCEESKKQPDLIGLVSISGIPVAPQLETSNYGGSLSFVIKNRDGSMLATLSHFQPHYIDKKTLGQISSLLHSEISDGDEDIIECKGNFNKDGVFEVKYIKGNDFGTYYTHLNGDLYLIGIKSFKSP